MENYIEEAKTTDIPDYMVVNNRLFNMGDPKGSEISPRGNGDLHRIW